MDMFIPLLSSQTTEEGSTVSCVIERMRGSLDRVYVNYTVTQLDSSDSETPANQDFGNASGAVAFMPGQRSEVCVLCVWEGLNALTCVHVILFSVRCI